MRGSIKKCCYTCKYLEYEGCSSDSAYCSGQKDAPRIERPVYHICDRYKNIMCKDEDTIIMDEPFNDSEYPIIEVTTPKNVFNTAYWIIGDIYIIESINTKVRGVYFLRDVSQTGDSICLVTTHHKLELTVEEFMSSFNVIKHISKESLIKDVI